MIYVLDLAVIVLATFTVAGLLRLFTSEQRRYERKERAWEAERRQLLDRLMHMQGRTWTPPPLRAEQEPEEESYADWPELEPIDEGL